MNDVNELSEQLLLAVKMQNPYGKILEELDSFPLRQLEKQLSNDTHKKAFWINIYNSFFQILRKSQKY